MSIESTPAARPGARADLVSAAIWIALGAAIVIASWRMDRLEHMGATLYTAPGLVPGLLGAMIVALGLALARRSIAAGTSIHATASEGPAPDGSRRFPIVVAMCLVYAIGLIGHAPFWLATFVFVTAFVAYFEYPDRAKRGQIARGIALAFIYGAATSAVVSIVFESVFLVRLP